MLMLLAFGLLLVPACSSDTKADTSESSAGPLDVLSYPGELSAYAPFGGGRWTESFSGVIMCTTSPIVVTDVEYSGPTEPLEVFATIHQISDNKTKDTPRTILSMQGRPDPSKEKWAALLGRFERVSDEGVRVNSSCAENQRVELITTMHISHRGGDVDSVVLNYQHDGEDYRLPIPNRYVACGDAITEPDLYCPDAD